MTCGYCQFTNSDEDHRCRRCGRRLMGSAVPAPAGRATEHARIAIRVLGANALAAVPDPHLRQEVEFKQNEAKGSLKARPAQRAQEIAMDAAATLDELPRRKVIRADQPSLFGAELQPKIIPFETLPRASAASAPARSGGAAEVPSPPKPKPATRKASAPADDTQATLDFLPAAKPAPRTLKTSAEAVIFCDAVAASTLHRSMAAVIDLGLIVAGFAGVVAIFEMIAKPAALNRSTVMGIAVMLGITALFYGLLFALSGTVTPGMRWTHLRLINFDGFPLDARSRALRFAGSWISVLSGGIGLFWAVLDEENLTWHDHMSKSFPTLRESESTVVRPGQKRQG